MKFWLLKSEPECFSIDMLKANGTTHWDGVRNYQARNFIREMAPGDQAFFYHSNCSPPGIIGVVDIISLPYPDHTAFDPNSEHPDLKTSPEKPRWFMVDIQFRMKFKQLISLENLKQFPELAKMPLIRKGNRLSVMPVTHEEWNFILGVAQ